MAYEIYSDESGCGSDRYEAIGTLSVESQYVEGLRSELCAILKKYNLSSCEYKTIRGAARQECASGLLRVIFEHVVSSKARVMVLVWDKHDSRHAVSGRDDIKNLSIMYYHALKTTKRMWVDKGLESEFYPDELTKLDFKKIISYIENGRLRKDPSTIETLFGTEFQKLFPKIVAHAEIDSKSDVLIQAIDIITGIVRLSYEQSTQFQTWKNSQSPQISLFSTPEPIQVSKSMTPKFILMDTFDQWCKGSKIQIALRSTSGFHSHRPSCGFFFWKYVPQRPEDKAPYK